MKKIPGWLIAWSLLIVLAAPSCQSTKSTATIKMFKFNFENGKSYDYEMIINTDRTVDGVTSPFDFSSYYTMAVTGDTNGTKTITTRFERFKLNAAVAGFNVNVDSDQPAMNNGTGSGKPDPLQMLNGLLGAMKGQRFNMKVNSEGKVESVSGFTDLAGILADSLKLGMVERQKLALGFNQFLNGESMKNQMERIFYIFPDKEVKVGDTWTKNSTINIMGNGERFTSTYTVTDIEGEMVTLEEVSRIAGNSDKGKTDGKITGTLVVDSRSGLVVKADQDTDLKITSANNKIIKIVGKMKVKGKANE